MELIWAYFNMVTVPHKMVGLGRMSDYRGSLYAHIRTSNSCPLYTTSLTTTQVVPIDAT